MENEKWWEILDGIPEKISSRVDAAFHGLRYLSKTLWNQWSRKRGEVSEKVESRSTAVIVRNGYIIKQIHEIFRIINSLVWKQNPPKFSSSRFCWISEIWRAPQLRCNGCSCMYVYGCCQNITRCSRLTPLSLPLYFTCSIESCVAIVGGDDEGRSPVLATRRVFSTKISHRT